MNKETLAYYLTYQFVPKPFHSNPKFRFPKTYDPKKILKQNEAQVAKGLYARLDRVIKSSLEQARGPVGLLLSGGLDSAILLYLLRKNTNKKIYTISGAYASDRSHLGLCAVLAKKYNTIHQELIITPADLPRLSELYLSRTQAPIGDNGFLATHLMLKALSPSARTIYTGDGADCLFHGLKAHYLDLVDREYLHRAKDPGSSAAVTRKLLVPKANYSEYAHYKYDEIFLTQDEARQYLGMELDLARPLKDVMAKIRADDPIKKTILLDLNFLVVNRVDYILKAAGANKVAMVLPYLDPAVVDYTLRIPEKYFIKDSEQKYILKKAFEGKLPKEVVFQKKKGMTPPFLEWYTKDQTFVLQTLRKAKALGLSLEYIRYLAGHIKQSSQYAYGMRIWLVLNLVLWHDGQGLPAGTRL